jgi:hypothetical protein
VEDEGECVIQTSCAGKVYMNALNALNGSVSCMKKWKKKKAKTLDRDVELWFLVCHSDIGWTVLMVCP